MFIYLIYDPIFKIPPPYRYSVILSLHIGHSTRTGDAHQLIHFLWYKCPEVQLTIHTSPSSHDRLSRQMLHFYSIWLLSIINYLIKNLANSHYKCRNCNNQKKSFLYFQQEYYIYSNLQVIIFHFFLMVKKAKIIFLGDTAVGKSCIISAINGHPISVVHEPTIGMDFSIKNCEGDKGSYKLQLWDTAGQQKFRAIMPSYIRNSKIIILVYDVTNAKTFANLEKWLIMIEQTSCKSSKLIIVGNKIDLYNERRVCMQKVNEKIMKPKLKYLQISAKTGEGISQLVQQIIFELDQMNLPDQVNFTQKIQPKQKQNQKCCKN